MSDLYQELLETFDEQNCTPEALADIREFIDELRAHPRFVGREVQRNMVRTLRYPGVDFYSRVRVDVVYQSSGVRVVFDLEALSGPGKIWGCYTSDIKVAIFALDRLPLPI